MPEVVLVGLLGLVTALATGLGALPLLLMKGAQRRALAIAVAVAGGVMLGASFGLMNEGFRGDQPYRTLMGMTAGLLFITVSQRLLPVSEETVFAGIKGANGAKMLLLVAVMTVHSFTEGVGVGVSFGRGQSFGIFITTAIAIHNIPEGLAISLAMVPRGASVWSAALWSIFSSLPQPLMAVLAYWFVNHFEPWLPVGLGFAAGAMIWLVLFELIPDALKDASPLAVAFSATSALIAMQFVQVFLQV